MISALRAAIEKIPTREERLGGQTFKYVKLSEVLDLLDTFRSNNADETQPAALNPKLQTRLREIAESLLCREGSGHYCPNCDNTTFDAAMSLKLLADQTGAPVETTARKATYRDIHPVDIDDGDTRGTWEDDSPAKTVEPIEVLAQRAERLLSKAGWTLSLGSIAAVIEALNEIRAVEPTELREADWKCTICGSTNRPALTHCVQCDWSRKHTFGGVLHERGCTAHPCVCGAVKATGPRLGDPHPPSCACWECNK